MPFARDGPGADAAHRDETAGEGGAVIITGASSGIGAGIAETMAAAGYPLVLAGRDEARLRATALNARLSKDQHRIVAVDLTRLDACDAIVDEATSAFGHIRCVVSNAGVFALAPVAEAPPAELERQWLVNVRAPYALTRLALPHMHPGASLVFVGSNLGDIGYAGTAAYTATKGAVHAMARALAVELADVGVRVNVVAPGFVLTPLTARLQDPQERAAALAVIPRGRLGRPTDIGEAVAYLASDRADFITGAVLMCDGGMSIA
jgi:NAD(P)-dependent dehydrogenase (short-subunit alcohol dehydrogenase family)